MNFKIIQLSDNICEKTRTQEFLFKQIKKEYGYGYVPEYHKDIINLNEYYINPRKNNLFLAKNPENDEIIATIAVRGYDKKFKEFEGLYNKEDTASIWRLYVDEKYRRLGLATKLFKLVESFSYLNSYKEIYLHTHKKMIRHFLRFVLIDLKCLNSMVECNVLVLNPIHDFHPVFFLF